MILYLYCDEGRDIWWNIVWARGKSRGQSPKDCPRAQAIFHCISWLESQYRHSQLQIHHWSSWEINAGRVHSPYFFYSGQYGKIFPRWLSNTRELNFNSIMFSNWECSVQQLCCNFLYCTSEHFTTRVCTKLYPALAAYKRQGNEVIS